MNYEYTHTKAVRGMIKTANRRKTGKQHVWMLARPTLDALWFQRFHRSALLAAKRAIGGA